MGIQPNFDTAQFEELLVDAGVDQAVARAHRSALAHALSQTVGALVTKEDQTLMDSRLETAIASQTAKIEARITDQTWRAMGFYAAFVTLVVGLATALIKLT